MGQQFSQAFPPTSHFDPERDMPDLTGKVAIVTGGNAGIGKEIVKELLQKNATVYMASRSKSKAIEAIAELKDLTGKEAVLLELDLASLGSITKAANEFKSKEKALHILFNSGGVMTTPMEKLTEDGYDLQFGTNTLGHAHLTMCLIPELLEGSKTADGGKSRVVNMSSDAAYYAEKEGVLWDTLRDGPERNKLTPWKLYFQSKFGNLAFSDELARRYGDQGIVSNAVHPGHIRSDISRDSAFLDKLFMNSINYPVAMGALTPLWAGTSPETLDTNGLWLVPWARVAKFSGPDGAPEVGRKLWTWVEEQRELHL